MMAFDYIMATPNPNSNNLNQEKNKPEEDNNIYNQNQRQTQRFNSIIEDENLQLKSTYLPSNNFQYSNLDQLSSSSFQNLNLNQSIGGISPNLIKNLPTSSNTSQMWNAPSNMSFNSNQLQSNTTSQYHQTPQRGLSLDSSNIWSQHPTTTTSDTNISANIWSPPLNTVNQFNNSQQQIYNNSKFLQQKQQSNNNLFNANNNNISNNNGNNVNLLNENYTSSNTNANNRSLSISGFSPPSLDEINSNGTTTTTNDYIAGSSSFSPPNLYDPVRRHSYTENLLGGSASNNEFSSITSTIQQPQQQFQQIQQPLPNLNDTNVMKMVDEYFESDPHERVKVTMQLLNDRFFHEEKYLSDAYQLPKFPIESSLRNYQLVLVGFKAGRIDVFYLPSSGSANTTFTTTSSSPTSPTTTTATLLNNSEIKLGDLVIVEADRGRDLGKVFKLNVSIDEARLLKLLQFQEQQAALNEHVENNILDDLSVKSLSQNLSNDPMNTFLPSPLSSHHQQNSSISPPTLQFPKSVLSIAQPNEIFQILNKKQDEEKACRLCLAKIANATSGCLLTGAPISPTTQDLLQMKLIDSEYQFDRKKLIFYYSTSKRIDFRDLVRELFRIYKTRIWMCAVIGLPFEILKKQNLSPTLQQQQQQQPQGQQPPGLGLNQPPSQFNGGGGLSRRSSLQPQPNFTNQSASNLQHHQTWPQEQSSQLKLSQYPVSQQQQPQQQTFQQQQGLLNFNNNLQNQVNDNSQFTEYNQNKYQQHQQQPQNILGSSEIYSNQVLKQNNQQMQHQQAQQQAQQQQQQQYALLNQQNQQAKQQQIQKVHEQARQQHKEQETRESPSSYSLDQQSSTSPLIIDQSSTSKSQSPKQLNSSTSLNSLSYSNNQSNEKLVLKSLVDIIDS
ncbi:hypothetical protein KGF54_005454 [Candida jiufengensis]|uniref:uncharacterized protein n=1 Tax=Candida jiufengensis TaxID=497108 RepID=UPI002224069B|nr:uncharacterized protein KGF54_005454 [Candida jiufengensis]KAI5949577.1 hypothetical protein KGF54_005454 [Candida jiufengensis]